MYMYILQTRFRKMYMPRTPPAHAHARGNTLATLDAPIAHGGRMIRRLIALLTRWFARYKKPEESQGGGRMTTVQAEECGRLIAPALEQQEVDGIGRGGN